MRRTYAIVLAALVLTGCGGSDKPPTLKDAAREYGCENVTSKEPELFADAAATCEKDGATVTLHTFSSQDAMDSWVNAAEGLSEGDLGEFIAPVEKGDLWVAQAEQQAADTDTSTDTPAEDPKVTCQRLFPQGDPDGILLQASDVYVAYLDAGQTAGPDLQAKAGTVETTLRAIGAQAPDDLADPVNEVADLLAQVKDNATGLPADAFTTTTQTLLPACKKYLPERAAP